MKPNPTTPDWVEVAETPNREYDDQMGGITFHLSIAPQNVPNGLRTYFDQSKELYVIEFRYRGYEPKEDTRIEEGIVLSTGVSTGRLFAIRIPKRLVKRAQEGHQFQTDIRGLLSEKVEQALSRMADDEKYLSKNVSRKYYAFTQQIVSENRSNLFTST